MQKIKWWEWDIQTLLKNKEELECIVGFELEQYKKEYVKLKRDLIVYDNEEEKISH